MLFRFLSLLCTLPALIIAQDEPRLEDYLNPTKFYDYVQIDGALAFDVSQTNLFYDRFAFGASFQIADEQNALFCRLAWAANPYLEDTFMPEAGPFSEIQYQHQRRFTYK